MSPRCALLYTRPDCPLCDEAEEILKTYGYSVQSIDITLDQNLLEKFELCIPVVEIDGKIRFRGKINETLLLRLIGN